MTPDPPAQPAPMWPLDIPGRFDDPAWWDTFWAQFRAAHAAERATEDRVTITTAPSPLRQWVTVMGVLGGHWTGPRGDAMTWARFEEGVTALAALESRHEGESTDRHRALRQWVAWHGSLLDRTDGSEHQQPWRVWHQPDATAARQEAVVATLIRAFGLDRPETRISLNAAVETLVAHVPLHHLGCPREAWPQVVALLDDGRAVRKRAPEPWQSNAPLKEAGLDGWLLRWLQPALASLAGINAGYGDAIDEQHRASRRLWQGLMRRSDWPPEALEALYQAVDDDALRELMTQGQLPLHLMTRILDSTQQLIAAEPEGRPVGRHLRRITSVLEHIRSTLRAETPHDRIHGLRPEEQAIIRRALAEGLVLDQTLAAEQAAGRGHPLGGAQGRDGFAFVLAKVLRIPGVGRLLTRDEHRQLLLHDDQEVRESIIALLGHERRGDPSPAAARATETTRSSLGASGR